MSKGLGKLHSVAIVLTFMLTVGLLSGCGGGGEVAPPGPPESETDIIVESQYRQANITLDGVDSEEVWNDIEWTEIPITSRNYFEMKSFYDDDNVYFLFRWMDVSPSQISTTGKWYVRPDGSWNWDFKSDGFSIVWDTSRMPNFAYEACTPLCHDQPSDLNRRWMGTENPADIQEFWNWNPGVTNAKGIMASYLWGALPPGVSTDDPDFNNRITWGELPGEYGFYLNRDENEIAPEEKIEGDHAPLWILKDEPASGDAALVQAYGQFQVPYYYLEVSRPRDPSNPDLTKFTVSENGWNDILFAAAVFHSNERDQKDYMQTAATLRLVGKNVSVEEE